MSPPKGASAEAIARIVEMAEELTPEPPRPLWIKFADHVERAIAAGGELESIRSLANKLPEHAARLAARKAGKATWKNS
jgi:hypothetical protein